MSNHIFEEGPRQGHAAGSTSVEQQASQLSSDIKYKARQKMKQTSGSALSPAQVQALYRQLLNASPAPGAVKSIVKQKLFKEQVDCGAEIVSDTVNPVSIMMRLPSHKNTFLLESVEGGTKRGRYSIIGMKPDLWWKSNRNIAYKKSNEYDDNTTENDNTFCCG